VIVLDTHVWVWWAQGDAKLPRAAAERIEQEEASGIGISAISCWEVAKLVEYDRLALPLPVEEWLITALSYPGMELVPISPRIAVESTQLPGEFHNDPADQLIVATARVLNCVLMTADSKIRRYPHVPTYPIT
jgi:PIN domain nuclease of toxin-antitoxin system